ncbi:hypothetical protein BGW80DRAFT_1340562 [Lactifluus volemus]|nr:hypothetical protein BGW80DRAFT_1340423 [Lactifluus volemus]KAH9967623.1 hypothetical protein BGW80DRAFT_1340562 [Lactifluus volemus]
MANIRRLMTGDEQEAMLPWWRRLANVPLKRDVGRRFGVRQHPVTHSTSPPPSPPPRPTRPMTP